MADEAPRILVIGSANVDMTMGLSRLPRQGETVSGGTFLQAFGGKGANQAVAAQRAAAQVSFVGCVGQDANGDAVLQALAREAIDVQWMTRSERAPTGVAVVLYDDAGDNCIAVAPGANHELTAQHLAEALTQIASFRMVVLQLEVQSDVVIAAVHSARQAGVPVLLNFAPARDLDLNAMGTAGVHLVVNEVEAAALAASAVNDLASAQAAAEALVARGFAAVVVTLGAQGAVYRSAAESFHTPAIPVRAVDTTAAGDTFCGAFAAAVCRGLSAREAVRYATAASSVCVQRAGALPSIPFATEIDAVLAGSRDASREAGRGRSERETPAGGRPGMN